VLGTFKKADTRRGRGGYRVALVVPSLSEGGGVPGVARFLSNALEASDRFAPYMISLAMSSRDDASIRLLEPRSWVDGLQVREGTWRDRPYRHVGARMVELEFMRYAPRRPLTELVRHADLVQVVAGTPCWALAAIRCEAPVLLQVATLTSSERDRRHRVERGALAGWRRAMSAITKRLDRLALRNVDRVFVENRWMEREAASVCGSERVVFAPPGVDTDRFHPRRNGDPPVEEDYILSVARFSDPRKNVELLFQAYARLVDRVPSSPPLWLAGSSPPPEDAWRVARKLGVADGIRYLGRVSDDELARLYRDALFFVLSSEEEGFGLVLAEAMASGSPVVSTACGGPDDLVTDGEDGFLVPVGDASMLSEVMFRLAERREVRTRMGRHARQTAVERYSHQVAGGRFLREYEEVLAARERERVTGRAQRSSVYRSET